MKVSVIIPAYNNAQHLHECLTSVLAQNFQDMEILIADDCSTDHTADIIRDFAAKDPRIRWWRNPRNLGLTPNHNACLREVRGEFIKSFHADDKFLHPDALARMVEILEKYPTVSLVCTGAEHMDGNSKLLTPQEDFWLAGNYDGKAAIVRCLEHNANLIGEPSRVMFRRNQAHRGYDERYRQLMDMELGFHLLEQGEFAYTTERLVSFRIHPGQATAHHHRLGICENELLLLVTEYCAKPWLPQYFSRRMFFKQIYYLRKNYGSRAAALAAGLMIRLKPAWYMAYWLEHKLIHPINKLRRRRYRKAVRTRG